jgi:dTDP-4-amino-4,6-dideoxygalactose transaminase
MHLYVIRVDADKAGVTRDALQKHLREQHGVGTAVHYPAVWDWEAFENDRVDFDDSGCDIARTACDQVLSLPVFPLSTEEDMAYVARSIRDSIQQWS